MKGVCIRVKDQHSGIFPYGSGRSTVPFGLQMASAPPLLATTVPSQMGVAFNLRLVENFAKHVAPALGWQPTLATV